MPPTIQTLLRECEERLIDVDSPRLSAELLAAEVLCCSRLTMIVDRNREVSLSEATSIYSLVERRATGEPIAYILGQKEFYGLDFIVTPDVLIPRPETEHIIETVETLYPKDTSFHYADLGTGSGILAVTLAHLFQQATGVAVDLSPGALEVARRNAVKYRVDERLSFLNCDFTAPLFPDHYFDLIVSNPPYVTENEFSEASLEVTDFEPQTALVSGEDGLNHIRGLLPRIAGALKQGGHYLMEIGWQQGDDIKKIISRDFPVFKTVNILKDLAGHDRVVFLQK